MCMLKHLSYGERLGSWDNSAWRREGSGAPYPCCNYPCLMGGNEEEGVGLFSAVSSERTRGNGHTGGSILNRMKAFSIVRMIKHCHSFPGEDVESPSVELFKTHGDSCPSSPVPISGHGSCVGCDPQFLLDLSLSLLCAWGWLP